MARRLTHRRRIVAAVNTALTAAALGATVAGWAAFGIADTRGAGAPQERTHRQPQATIVSQRAAELRRLVHPQWWRLDLGHGASQAIAITRSSR